jgi:hypothetical protein
MLRYVAVSTAAKAFSMNRVSRRAYRILGNLALERILLSTGLQSRYVERAVRLLDLCDRFDVLRPGDQVLELGTGWLHWEATVLRLFHDVEITLYDVCDNRLLRPYRSWVDQLRGRLDEAFAHLPCERREHARKLASRAVDVETFDELYDLLGFTYVVDGSGRLEGLPPSRYSLVVSADVLEHVPVAGLPAYLERMRNCTVPGGWSIHQIDLVDHLHYFDPGTSPKNYYRYDDATWGRWFESSVQYFNRVQPPGWLSLLDETGYDLIDEQRLSEHLRPIELASRYRCLSPEDLDCMQLVTVHRRPGP